MAVQVAAIDAIRSAARFNLVGANSGDLFLLTRVNQRLCCHRRLARNQVDLTWLGSVAEPTYSNGVIPRQHARKLPEATVTGIGEIHVAVPVALRAGAHVVAAGRL